MASDDGIVLNLSCNEFKTKPKPKKDTDQADTKVKKEIEGSKAKIKGKGNRERFGKDTNKKSSNYPPKKYIDPKDFVPVSSLFNKNPEIPSVPKIDAPEKNQEVLFSTDNVEHLDIGEKLRSNLKNHMDFTTLTTIQKLSIPMLLDGKDVMIKSPTGSGKTVCYSIPIVDKLSKSNPPISRMDGPFVLVIVPTRELALQTLGVFQDLCKCCISIVPGMLIGGEKCKSEKARLRKGVNILIATPGRLIYHMKETSCLDMSHIEYLVLDEADHLLDMGFREKITEIIEMVDKNNTVKRQSILLSATLTGNVKDLISASLKDPVFIDSVDNNDNSVDQNDLDYVTPCSLTQYFITVPAKLRLVTLIIFTLTKVLLKKGKAIVFTSSKNSVIFLSDVFKLSSTELFGSIDFNSFNLHGDMSQQERFKAFEKFKRSESGVLFCTDVASRGLDIKKVDWVIQYDCPTQTDDYLHRIGRTARIGERGNSVLFLLPSEIEYIQVLHKSSVTLSEIKVGNVLKQFAVGKHSRKIEEKAQTLQNKIEESVSGSKELHQKAVHAYKSFIQGYATYPKEMKAIFHIKLLHLGHIAKSFGLRKAPSNAIATSQKGKKRKVKDFQKESKRQKIDDLGEVSCGPRTKKEIFLMKKKKKPKIIV